MPEFGTAPFVQCGANGRECFRPSSARLRGRRNRSIEDIYRGAMRFEEGFGRLPREAAGGFVAIHREEVDEFWSRLWDEYLSENPWLMESLCRASGLVDASQEPLSVARELWRIRGEILSRAR